MAKKEREHAILTSHEDTNPLYLLERPLFEKGPKKIDSITPYLPIADDDMERRSTKGSRSYSRSELKAGYRKL